MLRSVLVLALLAAASGAAAQSGLLGPDPDSSGVYMAVEVNPELIGGIAGLQERVVYPEAARRAGVEGRVFVQFVVDEQGKVAQADCVGPPVNALLCESARTAVLASRFTPGRIGGQPVKVRFTLPVDYTLRSSSCLGLF